MPKRKKLPILEDCSVYFKEKKDCIIQKTNPLLTLSETDMTLSELKILDAYLAKIDTHNPDSRFIQLEKGEIEKLLGVTEIKSRELEKRVENLFQTITIRDDREPKGFTKIALFEKAICYQDNDGLWKVELGASQSAMEYIFYPENLGYLRYRLSNIVGLTSRYSYILYLYLEQQRFRSSWEISLEKLKTLLRCTAETYNEFKRFNDLVLKKCLKELTEKTECKFDYEPVRKGRSVVAIKFKIQSIDKISIHQDVILSHKKLNKVEEIDEEIDKFDKYEYEYEEFDDEIEEFDKYEEFDDEITFFQSACCYPDTKKPEFTRSEMKQIFEVLITVPKHKLPTNVGVEGIEFQRYHYLAYQYTVLNRVAETKPILNRFAYFVKILQSDAKND